MYYPIMIDLAHQKITIIGGGRVAYRKTLNFLAFEGEVTVVSPSFAADFDAVKARIKMTYEAYEERHIKESFLVVAATDNKSLNTEIGACCKAHGILCNVTSNPALSTFIVPSFIKRGELVISVSTGGNSPGLAKKIKKKLEGQYDESYGEYVEVLGRIRQLVIDKDLNETEKRERLNRLLEMNIKQLKELLSELGG